MKKMLLSLGILATLQVLAQNNAPTNPPPSLGAAPIVTYFDEGSPQFSPSTNSLLPAGCNRQGVIDDYTTNYLGTTVSTTELAWTGSTATCTPGTCSASATTKCLQRINYYRRLVGVPDNITFDQTTYEAGCQASSLIMHAQSNLSHNPPNTWACWTQLGYDYAGASNIALGAHSASALAMYMSDPGTSNTPVGHRRWILYSRASVFGIGSTSSANTLRVFGPTVTPAYMPSFVAYPSAGYFPRDLMMSRWSFSIPNANFSAATVSVTNEAGTPLSITVHPLVNGYGDNTIVWEMNTASDLTYTNDQDVVYNVMVSGITNAPQSAYTYKVVAIKTQTPTLSTTQINPGCGNNGLATVSYTAGIKSYLWSNSATTATANNLGAGTYTVTITDKNDCTATTTVTLVNVPYSVTAVPTHPTCGLNNGSISIVPEGIGYTWTGGLSGGNPTNVAEGTYTVTVTAAGGCTATASVTLVNTAVSSFPYCQDIENSSFGNWQVVNPENNITFIPFTLTNCTSNGSKVIQFPSWGTGLWNSTNTDDLIATFNLTNATSASLVFDVAYKGSYTNFGTILNVSAATGCGTNYTSIYNKSGSTLATVAGYEVNTSWQPANCSEWRTETINLSAYLGSVVTLRIRVSADPSNPYMGSYNYGQNLYLDDICVNAIVGNPCSSFTAGATPTQPTCGLNNGSITVIPAGGGYTYAWTGGLLGSNPTNVASGTYTVTVTNTSGCTATKSITLDVSSAVTATIGNIVQAVCNAGGSVGVTASGAVSPYTRLWSNGATTGTINNLALGVYTVTVTAANGCTTTAMATITNTTIATPTGLTTTNITATTATFSWNAVAGAANYTILGRKVGTTNWTTVGPVNGTSKNIQSQITACKTYEWKVRANCADGVTSSAYSNTVQFTTTGCGSSNKNELINGEWDNEIGVIADFNLLPNPADNWVVLQLESAEETAVDIVVTDVVGKIVSQHCVFLVAGENHIDLDIAALPKGYYMVMVHLQGGQMVKKMMVMQK